MAAAAQAKRTRQKEAAAGAGRIDGECKCVCMQCMNALIAQLMVPAAVGGINEIRQCHHHHQFIIHSEKCGMQEL